MKVIGLLSTQEEANEIKFIAQICKLEYRIRYLAQHQYTREENQ